MSAIQTETKITALYERLSHDDELTGDSNSVVMVLHDMNHAARFSD